jgi:hypothetical protein
MRSLLLACVLGAALLSSGQTAASARSAAVVRTDTPPVIDGVLDDPVWREAVPLDPMIQVEPVEGAEASERTEIRILYDSDHLYLGIRMFDSEPGRLIATQMVYDRDMTADDRINLIFDTFDDHRNAYLFQINPLGTRSEGLIENNANFRRDWDGIWNGETSVDERGWVAEVAIPFMTVALATSSGVWGFEAERHIRRKNEKVRWANPSRNRTVLNVAGIGTLTGLTEIDGTGVDLKPSGSLSYADAWRDLASGFTFDPDHVGKAGLDVSYKFHPSVTALLTINTDFMEAPVDEARTELTRFRPFFPERRDFFLQDAGIFEFGGLTENAIPFFSRRVGRLPVSRPGVLRLEQQILDIDAGLKLTGRVGDTSFGALHVRVPEQAGIEATHLSVARVQYNVLEESAIGLIGTQGDPLDRTDTGLVGADFQYFNSHFRGSNIVSGNAFFMRSFSDQGGSTQEAFGAKLEYPNDRYEGIVGFSQIGDDFDTALGFTNRKGIRQYDAGGHYRIRPGNYLRSVTTAIDTEFVTDLQNQLETLIVTVDLVEFENNAGDKIKLSYVYDEEGLLREPFQVDTDVQIPLGSYRFHRYGIRLETSNARPVRTIAEAIFGTYYSGKLRQLNGTIELRPSRYLFVSLEYEQNDGWLQEGDFTQRLARARVDLSLTPEISWTNMVQYDNDSRRIGLNSIFRWEIEPGDEFFVVFNQNWDEEGSHFRSAHTLFGVKVVWTFRF